MFVERIPSDNEITDIIKERVDSFFPYVYLSTFLCSK